MFNEKKKLNVFKIQIKSFKYLIIQYSDFDTKKEQVLERLFIFGCGMHNQRTNFYFYYYLLFLLFFKFE